MRMSSRDVGSLLILGHVGGNAACISVLVVVLWNDGIIAGVLLFTVLDIVVDVVVYDVLLIV